MASLTGAERVLALLDARMGEIYTGSYCLIDGRYVLQEDIRVAAPDAVALPGDPDWLACGNAMTAYPVLAARLSAAGIAVQEDFADGCCRGAAGRAASNAGRGYRCGTGCSLYIRDKVAKTVAERLSEGGRA
jgi:tRNA threonylcarbamoyladenosine biosynthesis protein TsaB